MYITFQLLEENSVNDIRKDPFEEYIKNLPPSRKEIGDAWVVNPK